MKCLRRDLQAGPLLRTLLLFDLADLGNADPVLFGVGAVQIARDFVVVYRRHWARRPCSTASWPFRSCGLSSPQLRGTGREILQYYEPFYHPRILSMYTIVSANCLAVLSFLGFDELSNAAEDSRGCPHPCTGTKLVCPDGRRDICPSDFPGRTSPAGLYKLAPLCGNEVCRYCSGGGRTGLYWVMIGHAAGAGTTGHASAPRMPLGMWRDRRLPRRFFGYIHPRLNYPDA